VQNFDDLAEALRDIANALCQASVTVTKLVDEGDGQYRPDPGWDFTATVSTSPGSYAWLQPEPPPATGARTVTTDDEGVARFQWQPEDSSATSTITIAETTQAGYRFVDATCTRGSPRRSRRTTTRRSIPVVERLVLRANEYYKCTVHNQIIPGTIEIVPPAAVTLSGLSATAGMRRVRGNAVWRLGTLAPGASRTVRGSVLIKAGTPGLKRNLALATAANAHLVDSRVDTRVLGPVRPKFTG
jgi:hypothetical protein